MKRRDTKLIFRVVLLMLCGLVLGFGVAVVKANSQIEKIAPETFAREVLLFVGPLFAIGMTSYSLANRSFSSRGLLTEWLIIGLSYSFFLSVVLPVAFPIRGRECRVWDFFCWNLDATPNFAFDLPTLLVAGLIGFVLWKREIDVKQS